MRLIKRFRQLSSVERNLFFRALVIVAFMRIGLRLLPFRIIRRGVEYFRKSDEMNRDLARKEILQVTWAVEAASRRIPGTMCLPKAMATHLLLGRTGQDSDLRIGVALNPAGQLEAHAWVEVKGRVVSGGAVEGFNRFVPLQGAPPKNLSLITT